MDSREWVITRPHSCLYSNMMVIIVGIVVVAVVLGLTAVGLIWLAGLLDP